MKILHITNAWPCTEYPIRGIFIKEQIETLLAQGADIDTYIISRRQGRGYFLSILHLRTILNRYDIFHAHHVLSALVCIAAGVPKERLICSFLNEKGRNILRIPSWASSLVETLVINRTGACIFKNSSFRSVARPRDVTIGNAVNVERFQVGDAKAARSALGLDIGKRYILFVSANDLHRRSKRYDLFKTVIEIVRREVPNLEELTLVNEDRDLVPLFFSAADALLICADHEGSPNAVKEALSSGVPVVSRNVGDVSDQILGIPDCEIVDPFTPEKMAVALQRALLNDSGRHHRRTTYLAKAPTSERVARLIIEVYYMLMSGQDRAVQTS